MSEFDLGNDLVSEGNTNSRPTTTEGTRPSTVESSKPSTPQRETRRSSTAESRKRGSVNSINATSPEKNPSQQSPLDSLSQLQLKKIRSHLLLLHRQVHIWSTILLTSVTDLLHCVGWDPISQSMLEITDTILLLPAKDLRSLVTGIFIAYSRTLSELDFHDLALTQLSRVLFLSPRNRMTKVLKIKTLSCLGNFLEAKELLLELIHQELYSPTSTTSVSISDTSAGHDTSREEDKPPTDYRQLTIVSKDGELGLLLLYVNIHLESLLITGFQNSYQQRVYEIEKNGLLTRPLHTLKCCEHGESMQIQKLIQNREKKLIQRIQKQREEENRNYYKDLKSSAVTRANQIIETNREMMINFGPVIIS